MAQYLLANIFNIFQNLSFITLQFKDIFDILVVGLLIYAILLMLKRTHSYFVLFGIFILLAIYSLARFFNFYLTSLVFQSFFNSIVVVLVIIFQKELRGFFEWISTPGKFRRSKKTISEIIEDQLVKVAEYLAAKKNGALIVLPGRQPLDRILEGGTPLDGEISVPLLLSIFDPTSPGHDGAVIIEGDKVKKFSAHLPLATKFRKVSSWGTRHRAALGLAESSDAFIIVVSEERGVISVANHGDLKIMADSTELKAELDKFLKKMEIGNAPLRSWLTNNLPQKIVSVFLAVTLWFIFVSQFAIISQEFLVKPEFRFLPNNLAVESTPKQITIILSGRNQDFQLLNPDALKVSIDAASFTEGTQTIKIEDKLINHPDALSVASFSPKTIQVRIKKAGQ